MKTFTLHTVIKADLPLIAELASRVWYITYGSIHSREQLDYMFDKMYGAACLEKQLADGHIFFIGYDEDIPIGYFCIEQKGTDLFYLQKLYVLPEYQGTGAGKFFFQSAVSHIKKMHPDSCILELNVNRQNKAVKFYEYMGMKKVRESDEEIGDGFVMNNCYMQKMI